MIAILLLGLAACHGVTSEKITAGDLALVAPEFTSVAADAVLGYAPAPGASRNFTPQEIERFAKRFGVAAVNVDAVCFEWPLHKLDRAELVAALKTPVEIEDYSLFAVPAGELEFPPAMRTNLMWRGYVRYADNRRVPIWVKVKADVLKGETVQVRVHNGGAELKLEGRAESTGAMGQMVSVRNLSSEKTFMAEVTGKGSVVVVTK